MKNDPTTSNDNIDDNTQEYLEFYFKPEEDGNEELDDVDVLEDLVEELWNED